MCSIATDFFLAQACEWHEIADELRASGVSENDPVLSVWREAAWCHLLLTRGLYDVAIARLREVFRAVAGTSPLSRMAPSESEEDVLVAAIDLFAHMRAVVFTRALAG